MQVLASTSPLNGDALLAALDKSGTAIFDDPIARYYESEGFDLERLTKTLSVAARSQTWEELFASLSGQPPLAILTARLARGLIDPWEQYELPGAWGVPGFSEAAEGVGDAVFVDGDLTVGGDFENGRTLVVLGHLKVAGSYAERGTAASLFVGGDFEATGIVASGTIFVGRDIKARMMHFAGAESTLAVSGTVRADCLVQDVQPILAAVFDVDTHVATPEAGGLAEVVDEALLDEKGGLRYAQLLARALKDQPILRNPEAAEAARKRICTVVT